MCTISYFSFLYTATLVGGSTGVAVGVLEGVVVGLLVGDSVGLREGAPEGVAVGWSVGVVLGTLDGATEGVTVGDLVGDSLGVVVGKCDGWTLGRAEGCLEGVVEGTWDGATEGVVEGYWDGPSDGTLDGTSLGIALSVGIELIEGGDDGAVLTLGIKERLGTTLGEELGETLGLVEGPDEGSLEGCRLEDGVIEGISEGWKLDDGESVGAPLGTSEGLKVVVGPSEGTDDGMMLVVGALVVGVEDGVSVGAIVGVSVGKFVGLGVGTILAGAIVGAEVALGGSSEGGMAGPDGSVGTGVCWDPGVGLGVLAVGGVGDGVGTSIFEVGPGVGPVPGVGALGGFADGGLTGGPAGGPCGGVGGGLKIGCWVPLSFGGSVNSNGSSSTSPHATMFSILPSPRKSWMTSKHRVSKSRIGGGPNSESKTGHEHPSSAPPWWASRFLRPLPDESNIFRFLPHPSPLHVPRTWNKYMKEFSSPGVATSCILAKVTLLKLMSQRPSCRPLYIWINISSSSLLSAFVTSDRFPKNWMATNVKKFSSFSEHSRNSSSVTLTILSTTPQTSNLRLSPYSSRIISSYRCRNSSSLGARYTGTESVSHWQRSKSPGIGLGLEGNGGMCGVGGVGNVWGCIEGWGCGWCPSGLQVGSLLSPLLLSPLVLSVPFPLPPLLLPELELPLPLPFPLFLDEDFLLLDDFLLELELELELEPLSLLLLISSKGKMSGAVSPKGSTSTIDVISNSPSLLEESTISWFVVLAGRENSVVELGLQPRHLTNTLNSNEYLLPPLSMSITPWSSTRRTYIISRKLVSQ
jgi:hypothetical protein